MDPLGLVTSCNNRQHVCSLLVQLVTDLSFLFILYLSASLHYAQAISKYLRLHVWLGCWMSHHSHRSHRPHCLKSSLMLSGQARQPIAHAETGSPLLVRSRARNLIFFWAEGSWMFMASIRSKSSFPTINIHQSSLHGTNEFNMAEKMTWWFQCLSRCLPSNHRKSSDNGLRLWVDRVAKNCQVQTWGLGELSCFLCPLLRYNSCSHVAIQLQEQTAAATSASY